MAPSFGGNKSRCYCLEELPKRGDKLMWRFPDSEYFKHFVYDDFPAGRKVREIEASVNFMYPIYVDEVRAAKIDAKGVCRRQLCLRPRTDALDQLLERDL